MSRFVGESAEDDIAAARSVLAADKGDRVALAYDGYLPEGDDKIDAVLVEVCERGTDYGLVFAQRYVPATPREAFKVVGNPVYLGRVAPLLQAR